MKAPVSSERHRHMIRALVIALMSVSITLGSWLHYKNTDFQVSKAVDQLRHSRVVLQRAEQQLQRLSDSRTHPLTRIVGEDVDVVQIRLGEFLRQYPASNDVSVQAFEQSMLPVSIPTAGVMDDEGVLPEFIQILRLDVEAVVSHAPALLTLLSELEQTAAGWPVDVRACDIKRTPLTGLNARCVMDVYYWQADMGT